MDGYVKILNVNSVYLQGRQIIYLKWPKRVNLAKNVS